MAAQLNTLQAVAAAMATPDAAAVARSGARTYADLSRKERLAKSVPTTYSQLRTIVAESSGVCVRVWR